MEERFLGQPYMLNLRPAPPPPAHVRVCHAPPSAPGPVEMGCTDRAARRADTGAGTQEAAKMTQTCGSPWVWLARPRHCRRTQETADVDIHEVATRSSRRQRGSPGVSRSCAQPAVRCTRRSLASRESCVFQSLLRMRKRAELRSEPPPGCVPH
jgi:hypothetical protein